MRLLQLEKPHIIVVVGLPGAGKTFFAEKFSDTFHALYLDYKEYSKIIGNESITAKTINNLLKRCFDTRQSLVMEGVGSGRKERDALVQFAKQNGYETLLVWVQTDPAVANQRAVLSKKSPISQKEFDSKLKQFENLSSNEPHIVISGKHTHPSQARIVLKRLTEFRTGAKLKAPIVASRVSSPGRQSLRSQRLR